MPPKKASVTKAKPAKQAKPKKEHPDSASEADTSGDESDRPRTQKAIQDTEMIEYNKPQFDINVKATTQVISFDDPIDITIKPYATEEELAEPRKYVVRIHGKSVNNGVVNAIRGVIMMDMPIFAFESNDIEYLESDCSTYSLLDSIGQLHTLPIPLLEKYNTFDFVDTSIYFDTPEKQIRFADYVPNVPVKIVETGNVGTIRFDLGPNTLSKKGMMATVPVIEGEIIKKNTTNEQIDVTSKDVQTIINGKKIDLFGKFEVDSRLFTLKPNEHVHIRMRAMLGCNSIRQGTFDATTSVTLNQLDEWMYDYKIFFKTLGQLPPDVIFRRACRILTMTYVNLKNYVESLEGQEQFGIIEIYGKRSFYALPIKVFLQRHAAIDFCVIDPNEKKKIKMTMQLLPEWESKTSLKKLLIQCLDYLIQIYSYLQEHVPNVGVGRKK